MIVHWGNDEYTCCNFGDVQMETTKMKLQLNGYFLYLQACDSGIWATISSSMIVGLR